MESIVSCIVLAGSTFSLDKARFHSSSVTFLFFFFFLSSLRVFTIAPGGFATLKRRRASPKSCLPLAVSLRSLERILGTLDALKMLMNEAACCSLRRQSSVVSRHCISFTALQHFVYMDAVFAIAFSFCFVLFC